MILSILNVTKWSGIFAGPCFIAADAVLIGEALMRAEDKTERLAEFKQAAVQGREKAAEQVQTSDAQSQASDGGKA